MPELATELPVNLTGCVFAYEGMLMKVVQHVGEEVRLLQSWTGDFVTVQHESDFLSRVKDSRGWYLLPPIEEGGTYLWQHSEGVELLVIKHLNQDRWPGWSLTLLRGHETVETWGIRRFYNKLRSGQLVLAPQLFTGMAIQVSEQGSGNLSISDDGKQATLTFTIEHLTALIADSSLKISQGT